MRVGSPAAYCVRYSCVQSSWCASNNVDHVLISILPLLLYTMSTWAVRHDLFRTSCRQRAHANQANPHPRYEQHSTGYSRYHRKTSSVGAGRAKKGSTGYNDSHKQTLPTNPSHLISSHLQLISPHDIDTTGAPSSACPGWLIPHTPPRPVNRRSTVSHQRPSHFTGPSTPASPGSAPEPAESVRRPRQPQPRRRRVGALRMKLGHLQRRSPPGPHHRN